MSQMLAPLDGVADFEAQLEAQRDRLLLKLRAQRALALDLWQWYHGRQPEPAVESKYRADYRLLLDMARTPWARLVVDTIAERLHVQGFRAPGPAREAEQVEGAAWALFRRSSMDADEWLVYTEALITGLGYVSVSADGLAPESAFEVVHEPAPGSRRRVQAALKLYPVDWSWRLWAVELYRPEATYRWLGELAGKPLDEGLFPVDREIAVPWEADDPFATPNPLDEVPVVPFENRATILGGGVSELADCIPILRRIDRLTLDKMMTSAVAGFRQKWATGFEVPTDPDTGRPIEPFKAAVDRLWISEDPASKFGTFEASDLAPYLSAIDAEIAALAAISRVPSHYLIQQSLANPPSAESLIAGESGLVAKVGERQRRYGEAWEKALRLGLSLGGPTVEAIEVVWKDAEMRNPAQVADAAVKLQAIGVPDRALWEYIGATPQQVDAWTIEAAAATLASPPPP